jgi:hypothetical protein
MTWLPLRTTTTRFNINGAITVFLLDDNNTLINAECALALEGPNFCIVIESSGGADPKRGLKRRNPDYNKLVTTLLTRLRRLGVAVIRIVLDSGRVADLPLETRIIPIPHPYPVDLATLDIEAFRKLLGRTIARMHRAPGATSSGNPQKRIGICIDRPVSVDELVTATATHLEIAPEGPPDLTDTERRCLRAARIGQGQFRTALLARYGGRCAANGLSNTELLNASHIKPWDTCTNAERLDPANGILLSALWDRLFDRGLITFEDDGTIRCSPLLSPSDRVLCDIGTRLPAPLPLNSHHYLAYHRTIHFRTRV